MIDSTRAVFGRAFYSTGRVPLLKEYTYLSHYVVSYHIIQKRKPLHFQPQPIELLTKVNPTKGRHYAETEDPLLVSNYENKISMCVCLNVEKKMHVHLVKALVCKYKIEFLNERKKSSTLLFAFVLHQPT